MRVFPLYGRPCGRSRTPFPVTADGNNHITGFSYDSSSNALSDGNYAYTWNGENELKTAGGVTYAYDGDGRSAAKVGSKLYWYGSGGEILAETGAAGNTLNEYVYFGGRRVALIPSSGSALFYAEDMLGSSRVIVQSNGTTCYDGDFTPFGAERAYQNSCSQNYKFTGKERDTESGLDNLGARYNASTMGRFMSPDPLYIEINRLANVNLLISLVSGSCVFRVQHRGMERANLVRRLLSEHRSVGDKLSAAEYAHLEPPSGSDAAGA